MSTEGVLVSRDPWPATPVLDAHVHLWELTDESGWTREFPVLHRSFSLDELIPQLATAGVDGVVLVQSIADAAETRDLLALAERNPVVSGVTGWVDLTAPDVSEQLAQLTASPGGDRLIGIRHLVQTEPDPRWLLREDVVRGVAAVGAAGLVYELLVRIPQLPAAVELATALPQVRFVLDHGGKPDIAGGEFAGWAAQISALAALPNVACKLSALVTEAGPSWTVEQIQPYATHLLTAFGADRVMLGSDWPVCLLAADYAEVTALNAALINGLSTADRAKVRGGTVAAWYALPGVGSENAS